MLLHTQSFDNRTENCKKRILQHSIVYFVSYGLSLLFASPLMTRNSSRHTKTSKLEEKGKFLLFYAAKNVPSVIERLFIAILVNKVFLRDNNSLQTSVARVVSSFQRFLNALTIGK